MTIRYENCEGEVCSTTNEVHSVVCFTCKAKFGPMTGRHLLLADAPSLLDGWGAVEIANVHLDQMGGDHDLLIIHWPRPKNQ